MDKSTPDARYLKIPEDLHKYDSPFVMLAGTDFRYMPYGDIYFDLINTNEFYRLRGGKAAWNNWCELFCCMPGPKQRITFFYHSNHA